MGCDLRLDLRHMTRGSCLGDGRFLIPVSTAFSYDNSHTVTSRNEAKLLGKPRTTRGSYLTFIKLRTNGSISLQLNSG